MLRPLEEVFSLMQLMVDFLGVIMSLGKGICMPYIIFQNHKNVNKKPRGREGL